MWDSSGSSRYATVTNSFYRSAEGWLLFFDKTNRTSFDELETRWLGEIQKMGESWLEVVLVGNKTDSENCSVSTEEASNFAADMDLPYIEISIKENTNVD